MRRAVMATDPIRLVQPHGFMTAHMIDRDAARHEALVLSAQIQELKAAGLPHTAGHLVLARRVVALAGDLTVRFGQFLQHVDSARLEAATR
jgi:hypothetical protein